MIDTSQIKPPPPSAPGHWRVSKRPWIIQIIAWRIQSIPSLQQHRASISFHYVEVPCLYHTVPGSESAALISWKGRRQLSVALIFSSISLHVSTPGVMISFLSWFLSPEQKMMKEIFQVKNVHRLDSSLCLFISPPPASDRGNIGSVHGPGKASDVGVASALPRSSTESPGCCFVAVVLVKYWSECWASCFCLRRGNNECV